MTHIWNTSRFYYYSIATTYCSLRQGKTAVLE